jgi:methionine synthase I (cobalamin-dependent)
MNFLDLLKEKVIVFDGAMGSNLQKQKHDISCYKCQFVLILSIKE